MVLRAGATLQYDEDGNLTSDGEKAYAWDARNRLVSLSGGGVAASFSYDAFGRRVTKTVNGVQTRYLYDGVDAVQEQSSGGAPSANMLVGGVDEVFTRADAQGASSVLHDGLGSALAVTDAAGTLAGEYSYEPFGSTTQTGASANASQYTGRENDATGLYYYRARYYSPRLQRFISEDGLDFLTGDTNLYAYAGNDPCNSTDPSGHVVQAAIVACGGGALFDAGLYAGIRWLAGKPFDGEGTLTAAQVGCISDVAGLGAAKAFTRILRGLKEAKAAKYADDAVKAADDVAKGRFFKNPDDLLPDLPRDAKGRIYPSDHIRIRPEKHPLLPGETYSPRHHGQHYHVDVRIDPTKSFNNKTNATKMKPPGYSPRSGTGFLPGETFPGW